MASLTTVKQWEDKIWRVELDTPWVGGEEGTANIQAKQLAARTNYLKDFADEVKEARDGEASLKNRLLKSGADPLNILSRYSYIDDELIAASTENVDVETGGVMDMDGIALKVGDLVFLKDQADKKQNGFWQAQTGAWNRSPGYQSGDKNCFTNKFIPVNFGAKNVGKIFYLDTDVYTVGSDPLTFAESLFSPFTLPGKAVIRDKHGKINNPVFSGPVVMSTPDLEETGQVAVTAEWVKNERFANRIVGEYKHLAFEPAPFELAKWRLLPLQYQLIEIALYEELCTRKWVGEDRNNTADWWYKCDHLGNRTVTGSYMRVEDARGLFFRNAGANAIKRAANDTPYDGFDAGTFQRDCFQNHHHGIPNYNPSGHAIGYTILITGDRGFHGALASSEPWGLPGTGSVRTGSQTQPASISVPVYMAY